MGINGLIPYISSKYPSLIVPTPYLEFFAGKRIFIDCAIVLQRSLHASLRAILKRRRYFYNERVINTGSRFIDVDSIKEEILNYSVKPLLLLNKSLKSIRKGGGIDATFVLGSSFCSKNTYNSGKSTTHLNILDTKNPNLVQSLINFMEGNEKTKFYPALSEKDIFTVADRLTDSLATIQIRNPDIAKRCVEFCSSDDYVLSDDTNVIAYGAPNVIRDYFGRNECNTINHSQLLNTLGELGINFVHYIQELTREQFIDFCILCGYKHNVTIPGIGPERAYNIIRAFNTLDNFLSSTLYESLLSSKLGIAFLSKYNMSVQDFTEKYFNLNELRSELSSIK